LVTTGETAKRGTGLQPDTGGGWVNGRSDGKEKFSVSKMMCALNKKKGSIQ